MESPLPFLDRIDAGHKLAEELLARNLGKSGIVLGLLRGGAEVGAVLARELGLTILPFNVRKIGHPANPEFALGAIAEGGGTYLDEEMMNAEGISFADIEPIIEREMEELRRRREAFPRGTSPSLRGRNIILTDDGAATGATLLAAIDALRKAKVKAVTVAVPVCAPDTAHRLREAADTFVTLATPAPFYAVAQWYLSFPQLSDDDVRQFLTAKR